MTSYELRAKTVELFDEAIENVINKHMEISGKIYGDISPEDFYRIEDIKEELTDIVMRIGALEDC